MSSVPRSLREAVPLGGGGRPDTDAINFRIYAVVREAWGDYDGAVAPSPVLGDWGRGS